jgi:hypothetical protein
VRREPPNVFDKFLENQPEPKPEKVRKYPKRFTERHGKNGRVLPKFRKRNNGGSKHWKVKKKKAREDSRKARSTPKGTAYVKRYNASLRRKYIQNRSFCKRFAARHGIDPDVWYTLTYEDWVDLWTTTEDVFIPDRGFVTAIAAQGKPSEMWKTWCSRLDPEKPWSRENVVVRFSGPKIRHSAIANQAPTLKNRLHERL